MKKCILIATSVAVVSASVLAYFYFKGKKISENEPIKVPVEEPEDDEIIDKDIELEF